MAQNHEQCPHLSSETDKEASRALRRGMLFYVGQLVKDARQQDVLADKRANELGLLLRDGYIQEAPNQTPLTDAISILTTPDGKPLPHLIDNIRHFKLFVPDNKKLNLPDDRPPAIVWAVRVHEDGTEEPATLTEDGFQPSIFKMDLSSIDDQVPAEDLGFQYTLDFYQDLQTQRLAPQFHA